MLCDLLYTKLVEGVLKLGTFFALRACECLPNEEIENCKLLVEHILDSPDVPICYLFQIPSRICESYPNCKFCGGADE